MNRAGLALLAMTVSLTPLAAQADAPCTDANAPAWTSHGGDASNARAADSTIDASTIGALALRVEIPTTGVVHNTPIIAGGCIFLATDAAHVSAHTFDGTEVWRHEFTVNPSGYGGLIVGSPLYHDGILYVALNRASAPTLARIDASSGEVLGETILDTWADNFASAAPVLAGDLIFVGISGAEGSDHSRGGYALTELDGTPVDLRPADETTTAAYAITDAEYEQGYRGASLWSSPAFADGFIFVGGGNPASKILEHRYSNAMLKIDTRRDSDTFGVIVDAYKGDTDHYYPGLERQPVCEAYPTSVVWSPTCVQLDLDFGASPNLWVNEEGKLIVGAMQKSGIFHAAYADSMTRAWTSIVGLPCVACNASTSSVANGAIVAVGTPGGQMWSLRSFNGAAEWVLPILDGVHFGPTTTSNDVAFTVTTHGFVLGVDAGSGVPVFTGRRSDQRTAGNTSAGVAIVGDALIAPVGNLVQIYTLD